MAILLPLYHLTGSSTDLNFCLARPRNVLILPDVVACRELYHLSTYNDLCTQRTQEHEFYFHVSMYIHD